LHVVEPYSQIPGFGFSWTEKSKSKGFGLGNKKLAIADGFVSRYGIRTRTKLEAE